MKKPLLGNRRGFVFVSEFFLYLRSGYLCFFESDLAEFVSKIPLARLAAGIDAKAVNPFPDVAVT